MFWFCKTLVICRSDSNLCLSHLLYNCPLVNCHHSQKELVQSQFVGIMVKCHLEQNKKPYLGEMILYFNLVLL